MAWQPPNCLLHAMQAARLTAAPLRSCLRSSPRAALLSHPQPTTTTTTTTTTTRGYATDAEQVKAAPEIDFSAFQAQPTRIVPKSRSYFSGSPRFLDHMLNMEALLAKHAALPTVSAQEAPRKAWFKLVQFRDYIGETVPTKKYKGMVKLLQRLNRIDPSIMPREVDSTLTQFLRPGNPYAVTAAPPTVDEMGRARGKGKRKTSSAVVYLVEGEGEVLVNGKSLAEAFPRIHDRESATWPLRCTSRLDKYNVWASVQGGGTTGQAEAILLALGRALLVHEPGLKPALRKAGAITVDPRRVERKKPGHVKARKMPTWVKR